MRWIKYTVLNRTMYKTRGLALFIDELPHWFHASNVITLTDYQKRIHRLFNKYRKCTPNLGLLLIPKYIEYGNPDIAWLYCEKRNFYVPVQAAFLSLLICVYGVVTFYYRKPKRSIWVRAPRYMRSPMRSDVVGLIREYRVEDAKLRLPPGF